MLRIIWKIHSIAEIRCSVNMLRLTRVRRRA
jgi:hypothetical protein